MLEGESKNRSDSKLLKCLHPSKCCNILKEEMSLKKDACSGFSKRQRSPLRTFQGMTNFYLDICVLKVQARRGSGLSTSCGYLTIQ